MKKYMVKNVVLCLLVATCVTLTVRLWFGNGFFEGLFMASPVAAAADPLNQPMAQVMARAATLGLSVDGKNYHVFHGIFENHEVWGLVSPAVTALIGNGAFSHMGLLEENVPPGIEQGAHILIEYSFSMPTSFFRENFGQRSGFLSSHFGSFENLAIFHDNGIITFYFYTREHENANYHAFVLDNAEIYENFERFFVGFDDNFQTRHVLDNAKLVLHDDEADTREIRYASPIRELRLSTVEEFIRFFFPNPAAITTSNVNNVYTYIDNFRAVKFHPGNIVEYSSLTSRGNTSFDSAFLAALEMIDRDRASMESLGDPMNDVVLSGYYHLDGQWTFYFDYVVDGLPMVLKHDFLYHAIEIDVTNNAVVRYQRLMMQFYTEE